MEVLNSGRVVEGQTGRGGSEYLGEKQPKRSCADR